MLEASQTTPVVVDFWAEWCGPCKIIGPILEKLAAEAQGEWKLVKVDTEAWPDLAQIFNIRAIPTVVMIHQGQPISQFKGALPEDQIRQWLNENLPGLPPSGLDLAKNAYEEESYDEARQLLVRTLATDPDNTEAKGLLVRVLFRFDLEAAAKLAEELPAEGFEELKANMTLLRDLVRWDRGETTREIPEASEKDLSVYRQAAEALSSGDFAGAVESWLAVMALNRKLDNDGARRAAIALFDLLGSHDPISRDGRRRMASLLF